MGSLLPGAEATVKCYNRAYASGSPLGLKHSGAGWSSLKKEKKNPARHIHRCLPPKHAHSEVTAESCCFINPPDLFLPAFKVVDLCLCWGLA